MIISCIFVSCRLKHGFDLCDLCCFSRFRGEFSVQFENRFLSFLSFCFHRWYKRITNTTTRKITLCRLISGNLISSWIFINFSQISSENLLMIHSNNNISRETLESLILVNVAKWSTLLILIYLFLLCVSKVCHSIVVNQLENSLFSF